MANSEDIFGSLLKGVSSGLKTYGGAKYASDEEKRKQDQERQRLIDKWEQTHSFNKLLENVTEDPAAKKQISYANQHLEELNDQRISEGLPPIIPSDKDYQKLMSVQPQEEAMFGQLLEQALIPPESEMAGQGAGGMLAALAPMEGIGSGSFDEKGQMRSVDDVRKMVDYTQFLPDERLFNMEPGASAQAIQGNVASMRDDRAMRELLAKARREKAAKLAVEGPPPTPEEEGAVAGRKQVAKDKVVDAAKPPEKTPEEKGRERGIADAVAEQTKKDILGTPDKPLTPAEQRARSKETQKLYLNSRIAQANDIYQTEVPRGVRQKIGIDAIGSIADLQKIMATKQVTGENAGTDWFFGITNLEEMKPIYEELRGIFNEYQRAESMVPPPYDGSVTPGEYGDFVDRWYESRIRQ